jgi:hypothetical protein
MKPFKSRQSLISHFSISKCGAMFLLSHYKEHYPDWFEIVHIEINFTYSEYSVNLADSHPGTCGSVIVRNSRFLLADSQDEFDRYRTVVRADANAELTGSPLLFRLRKMITKNKNRPKALMKIFWAPHWKNLWQDSNDGLTSWEIALEAVHKLTSKNLDKEIVFRSKPLLLSAIDVEFGKGKILKNRLSIRTQESDNLRAFA